VSSRLPALLAHPSTPIWATVLVCALSLPTLGFGLMADDYLQKVSIQAWQGEIDLPPVLDVPMGHPLLDGFTFLHGDPDLKALEEERGLLPWWAPEDIKARFFRPLTMATHLLDYALWPDAVWLMHLHSLGWMIATLLLALALFRGLHGATPAAVLAWLLFALEDTHGASVAWIANRNVFVALVFGLLALLAHHRWRGQGRAWAMPAAASCFALALLAGEAALAVGGYLLAYALFLDPRGGRRGLISLVPYAAVGVAWAAAYHALDYGTAGADSYVSPTSLGFVTAVVERTPILLAARWYQLPSDIWLGLPRIGQLGFSVIAAVLVSLLMRAWLPLLRDSALARFWSLGMVLAAIPVCASFPMDRLLVFVGLGAAGLLACWAEALGRTEAGPALPGRLLTVMLVLQLVVSPLLFPVKAVGMWAASRVFETADRHLPAGPEIADQDFVFVNGAFFFAAYPAFIRAGRGEPVFRRGVVLTHSLATSEITRLDDRSLRLQSEGGFLKIPTEAILRGADPPFEVGQVIRRGPMQVHVDEVTGDGRPAVVTATFEVPLEDPSLRWLVSRDGGLQRFELPVIGETVRVEPCLPPIEF